VIVRDFRVFLMDAVMRTTGMMTSMPLVAGDEGGCVMVPLGWIYSSLTGMGSETSQSSSLMCNGLPVSSETILVPSQYAHTFSPKSQPNSPIPSIQRPPYALPHLRFKGSVRSAFDVESQVLCNVHRCG
jgi:hypothetical protein